MWKILQVVADFCWKYLQRIFAYGCAGLLIEVFFTAVVQLLHGDWNAAGETYLWMLPIYGLGGVLYDELQQATKWDQLRMAAVYTPLIYIQELLWGLLLSHTIGSVPWSYGHHWWTPGGYVNLAYMPLWFGLSYGFQPARLLLRRLQALR